MLSPGSWYFCRVEKEAVVGSEEVRGVHSTLLPLSPLRPLPLPSPPPLPGGICLWDECPRKALGHYSRPSSIQVVFISVLLGVEGIGYPNKKDFETSFFLTDTSWIILAISGHQIQFTAGKGDKPSDDSLLLSELGIKNGETSIHSLLSKLEFGARPRSS
jgi:hypothetical protein